MIARPSPQRILFFLLVCFCALPLLAAPAAEAAIPTEPAWRLDGDRAAPPIHFRRDEPLRIAGGGQPSKTALVHLHEQLGLPDDTPLWVIDMRQESHGYLNEDAVSWHGVANAANRGMSAAAIEQDERQRLADAVGANVQAVPMGHYDEAHIPYTFAKAVTGFATERHIARKSGLGYVRIAATDMRWPEPRAIDDFVNFYRSLPKEHGWLYFHCQAGQGRTTTFMVLYELLENPSATADEAIAHQRALGGADLSSGERYEGICRFAQYVRENRATDFAQSWSDWLSAQQSAVSGDSAACCLRALRFARRSLKKRFMMPAHSSCRTPAVISGRWLSARQPGMLKTDSQAPALASVLP